MLSGGRLVDVLLSYGHLIFAADLEGFSSNEKMCPCPIKFCSKDTIPKSKRVVIKEKDLERTHADTRKPPHSDEDNLGMKILTPQAYEKSS